MKTIKFLAIMAFVAMATSCSDNTRTKEFLEKFSTAVNNKDTTAVIGMYPNASEIKSFVTLDYNADNVEITEDGDKQNVKIGNVSFVLVKDGDEGYKVESSHGLLALQADKADFATKTGQYNPQLTDKENAEALADTVFEEFVSKLAKESMKNVLEAKVVNYNVTEGDFHTKYVITNNSDYDIPGSEYKVRIEVCMTCCGETETNSWYKSGIDVPAHGSATFPGRLLYQDPDMIVSEYASIKLTGTLDPLKMGYKPKGTEWKEYKASKGK